MDRSAASPDTSRPRPSSSPPSSPWNQANEFSSTPRSSTTRALSNKTPTMKQVVMNGKMYGVNLVDRRTGRTYYYDFETCESQWGDLPPNSTPSGYSAASAKQERDDYSTQDLKQEWIRLVDHQGREFEYNRRTCDSRWAS